MKLAFISDVHSNASALSEILRDIQDRQINTIYCAGDIVGYNASPNRTVNLFREYRIQSVRGNHDEAVLTETPNDFSIVAKRATDWTRRQINEDNRKFLRDLPPAIRTNREGVDLYITHGSPSDNLNEYVYKNEINEEKISRWFDKSPELAVLGHTHRQFVVQLENTTVLNPGSVGQPRDGNPEAAYAVFDTEENIAKLHRVKYDIDVAAERTRAVLPRKLADRLYNGR